MESNIPHAKKAQHLPALKCQQKKKNLVLHPGVVVLFIVVVVVVVAVVVMVVLCQLRLCAVEVPQQIFCLTTNNNKRILYIYMFKTNFTTRI